MDYSIETILDRLEDDKAVLVTPWGQEIFWPQKDIPPSIELGQTLQLFLAIEKPAVKETAPPSKPEINSLSSKEQNIIAKRVLEELLNGST